MEADRRGAKSELNLEEILAAANEITGLTEMGRAGHPPRASRCWSTR